MLGVVAFLHFLGKTFGIGGGRIPQLVSESFDDVFVFVALFADLGIRADGETVERDGAFLCPFGEGLGKQIQAGDEEEHEFVFPGHFLGNLEAGEGFTGTAGHDELATVGGFEIEQDVGLGAGLVGAELFFGFEDWGGAGLVFCPIDLAVGEVVEVDLVNGRLLVTQGVLGVLGPVIGGGDNDTLLEWFLAGGCKETVNVFPANAIITALVPGENRPAFTRAEDRWQWAGGMVVE